ncbi:vacuolar assembling/sorting protein VPS16 [Coprinellus micaceus]|uniref:Probable vacuolar protein sorting-associated protein 16 homolog n=1 Tax=Coprinellus micaceus TaxID=71717 RepID=A0A4Y7TJM7_COPMI|nr:vacuolar assembling/sorting protein VPS16 [Coprinellus micaceus]
MSTPHPTTTWQAMQDGNTFYRRQQLYSVPGKLPELSDYIVAGCQYGGPIALMRDSTKLLALGRVTPAVTKAQIQVFSPAGEGLLLFSWDQGRIVKFGWTVDERLIVLNEEGVYRLYDLQGEYQQHSLGTEAAEMGIIDAKMYGNGLVALTSSLTLLEVKGWEGARPLTLANPGLSEPPHAWSIIPPDLNISRHVEVLLSTEQTIFTVDNLENIDQRLSRGPFTHISPSPNGKFLALLTFTGTLWVVSTDFQRNILEFETTQVAGVEGSVQQVEWCGNDAIILTWPDLLLLVGPSGETIPYTYGGSTFALTEMDGIRVISSDVCDLIQKVPTSTLSVFKPGSTSASAILYDAWENFTRKSPKADENVRSIRPDLARAVDECIDAAGREWEPYWQRRILNAAKFGRGFLDFYNPTDFVNMGQTLKVLNAVRFYEVGIPLTYTQYNYASPSHLIGRLTSRNMHLLALRISSFLGLKPDAVLKHWACAKIMRSRAVAGADASGDDEVCKAIVEKFDSLGGADVSYAEIAKKAWEVGRPGLATRLLDHESKGSDQVPLLLEMKEDKLALVKAVDSGDTDLVYYVLLHLYKRLPLGSFFKLLEDGGPHLAPATRLLEVYARQQNREMLRDFYYSDDRRVESAILCLEEATWMREPSAKISAIKAGQKFFSEDKDRSFEAKMMDDYSRLLSAQHQFDMENDGKISSFGTSINETIRLCLVNGMAKKAEKFKSDFKVPDKRFWYIKLKALAEIRDFEGLEAFAKSKRSPIGYEPFVKHLIEKGYSKDAVGYVAKCDSPKRADLYAECGEWRLAGQECKTRGDKTKLEELRRRCPNSMIARELDQILASMK